MNKLFSMLDQPISKDWIFYLWIVSIIAIIPGTLTSELNGGGLASFLIGVVIQYLFFLVLPATIRKVIRKK
jgi:hypothetical protein